MLSYYDYVGNVLYVLTVLLFLYVDVLGENEKIELSYLKKKIYKFANWARSNTPCSQGGNLTYLL